MIYHTSSSQHAAPATPITTNKQELPAFRCILYRYGSSRASLGRSHCALHSSTTRREANAITQTNSIHHTCSDARRRMRIGIYHHSCRVTSGCNNKTVSISSTYINVFGLFLFYFFVHLSSFVTLAPMLLEQTETKMKAMI